MCEESGGRNANEKDNCFRLSSTSGLFSIYFLSLNNKDEYLLSAAEETIEKLNELVPPFY
jgi:hypothetical protein